ncbi:MAG: ATP-binding cassette domain-containing protein [Chloroflexota bacterium]|nr:ATP-binding cassette domain-containing protein [Chloroflexota bacterium]
MSPARPSTLIKILSGVYHPDQGTILLQGQPVAISSPHAAQSLGIITIHQELALVPYLSVAENIFLNREPRSIAAIGMVDFGAMKRESERLLADLGVYLSGDTLVGSLIVAAQQMVEIARAISRQANLILMDEPTSALSSRETQTLLTLMQHLKVSGVSVVFISHRLEEILQVADRIIIMRDSQRVATMPVAEASEEKIIRAMIGRTVGLFPKEDAPIGDVMLEARNLSGHNGVQDVSFSVRSGKREWSVANHYVQALAIATPGIGKIVGRLSGVVIGSLLIGTLQNEMIILNINPYWHKIVISLVLLVAITVDYLRRRRRV